MLRPSIPLMVAALCACGGSPTVPAPEEPATQRPHAPRAVQRPEGVRITATERDLEGIEVHLSIDDLPWQIERGTPMPIAPGDVVAWNMRVGSALKARNVEVSAFFVCERVQLGANTIELWRDLGHTVGNHTHTHAPLAELGPEAWLADVERCHDQLHGRLEARPTWFRFPYLGHGDGPEMQQAARAGLAELGYRVAPVTVATTEWMYAYAYRRAQSDRARRDEIVVDWHRHMDDALAEAIRLARATQGRDVPQVVLVHMNELLADHGRDLIDRWTARGVQFVDLETAMADPVYALEPTYTGRAGLSWLVRVADPEHRQPYWFGDEEERVVARFGPMPVKGEE